MGSLSYADTGVLKEFVKVFLSLRRGSPVFHDDQDRDDNMLQYDIEKDELALLSGCRYLPMVYADQVPGGTTNRPSSRMSLNESLGFTKSKQSTKQAKRKSALDPTSSVRIDDIIPNTKTTPLWKKLTQTFGIGKRHRTQELEVRSQRPASVLVDADVEPNIYNTCRVHAPHPASKMIDTMVSSTSLSLDCVYACMKQALENRTVKVNDKRSVLIKSIQVAIADYELGTLKGYIYANRDPVYPRVVTQTCKGCAFSSVLLDPDISGMLAVGCEFEGTQSATIHFLAELGLSMPERYQRWFKGGQIFEKRLQLLKSGSDS